MTEKIKRCSLGRNGFRGYPPIGQPMMMLTYKTFTWGGDYSLVSGITDLTLARFFIWNDGRREDLLFPGAPRRWTDWLAHPPWRPRERAHQ